MLGCTVGVRIQPSWRHHPVLASISAEAVTRSSSWCWTNKNHCRRCFTIRNGKIRPRRRFSVPENREAEEEGASTSSSSAPEQVELEIEWKPFTRRIRSSGIISSCLVGLLTGVAVVLFNNAVHEIRDLFWDGIPSRGASWLRETPIEITWKRVILVPAFGGVIVAVLNLLRETPSFSASRPFLKAIAASVTLGTGNSLGPEGPSVEIGTSIAKGITSTSFFDVNKGSARMLPLLAAGSAAGLSAGFNAAVAGCFFAVESVLWPSPADANASLPLANTTSTVILSAVIASVVSEIGLGSEPAFKVPDYDFRSPGGKPSSFFLFLILSFSHTGPFTPFFPVKYQSSIIVYQCMKIHYCWHANSLTASKFTRVTCAQALLMVRPSEVEN